VQPCHRSRSLDPLLQNRTGSNSVRSLLPLLPVRHADALTVPRVINSGNASVVRVTTKLGAGLTLHLDVPATGPVRPVEFGALTGSGIGSTYSFSNWNHPDLVRAPNHPRAC
jgi:hypothetical protein